jgi:ferric-dicitrate binding protein FerR (iron transport regulator)
MSWRPANTEPENNRAWAGVHWLNQEIRAESILRPTAARADSTALSRRSELSLITRALLCAMSL